MIALHSKATSGVDPGAVRGRCRLCRHAHGRLTGNVTFQYQTVSEREEGRTTPQLQAMHPRQPLPEESIVHLLCSCACLIRKCVSELSLTDAFGEASGLLEIVYSNIKWAWSVRGHTVARDLRPLHVPTGFRWLFPDRPRLVTASWIKFILANRPPVTGYSRPADAACVLRES